MNLLPNFFNLRDEYIQSVVLSYAFIHADVRTIKLTTVFGKALVVWGEKDKVIRMDWN